MWSILNFDSVSADGEAHHKNAPKAAAAATVSQA